MFFSKPSEKKLDCKYFSKIQSLFSVTCFGRVLLPFEMWESILPHPVYIDTKQEGTGNVSSLLNKPLQDGLGSALDIILITLFLQFENLVTISCIAPKYNSISANRKNSK
jgi:hypothetical protein